MLNVGAIGYRGHAKTVIDLVNRSGKALVSRIYHPFKRLGVPEATNELDDLLQCDAVMILSPDATHFEYLDFLSARYGGYVFCEKPPGTSREQLEMLRTMPHDRVFFNFNFRFSRLRDVIEEALHDGSLGTPIHCSVFATHGLAFKEAYLSSWRGRAEDRPHLIAETAAIHYIDFLGLLFGRVKGCQYNPTRVSGRSRMYDTSQFCLQYSNGMTANLLASYAAPLTLRIFVIGTNGIIEATDRQIRLHSPRDVYDNRGYFATPPCQYQYDYPEGGLFGESLERSVEYFLNRCEGREVFSHELYEKGLASSDFALSLGEGRNTKTLRQ